MAKRGSDCADVRVGLTFDETREAVELTAADADAAVRIGLVEHHADGERKRPEPRALEVVGQLLDPGLVADSRVRERLRSPRLARVRAGGSVHVVEALGGRV